MPKTSNQRPICLCLQAARDCEPLVPNVDACIDLVVDSVDQTYPPVARGHQAVVTLMIRR